MRSRTAVALVGTLGLGLGCPGCWRADLYPVRGKLADGSSGAAVAGDATGVGGATGALYVAPDGDDANPGSLAQPLRTVARARDLVRGLNAAMTADIAVYLRGGTYPQTSPLTFANADSGNGGFYVKYMAYQNERPLITGGQPITGWKLSDANNNIYSASGVTSAFRQLYVNGVKAVRARSPNLAADGGPNFSRATGYSTSDHTIQVAASEVANWKNLTKVEMHYMTEWGDNVLRLASLTTSGSNATLKFQSSEDAILFVRSYPYFAKNQCYFFENALEFLDQPGEWYLDESAKVLYYKPRAGEDMASATVVAPMLEAVMSIAGTSPSQQIEYLWFQGLTFAHSTFMRPSRYGFLDQEAGQYGLSGTADNKETVGRPPAGVTVSNANHIHFERNMFAQMAATGLDFVSGTHDDMIIGNVFTEIGGSGLSVGKFVADEATEVHVPYNPTDTNEICTNDTIKDNYVNHVTTEIQGACGIACGYPRNIDIEHNEVTGTNYSGILVGYGWTASTNAMSDNKINYNNIHDVVGILAGGAGIETLSNQGPSSEMQYNYLHDFGTSTWADYDAQGLLLNVGTTGYTVAHNVMANTPGVSAAGNAVYTANDNGSNPSGAQNTMASAGIESIYADIKNLTIPAASF